MGINRVRNTQWQSPAWIIESRCHVCITCLPFSMPTLHLPILILHLPKTIPRPTRYINLLPPQHRPHPQPHFISPQLRLNPRMPTPRRKPRYEIPWPEDTSRQIGAGFLVHCAARVAREDEESAEGAGAGLEAFVEGARCETVV